MGSDKQKAMEEVAEKIKELNELDMLESLITDNVHEFAYNDKHYRIRKLTPIEKDEANRERMKKYFKMLKDPDYMFRKDLIELYKTKNIDIEAIENDFRHELKVEKELLKKLYGNDDPNDIELIEAEIEKCREKQRKIFFQKEDLLQYCIEKQLEDFLKFYMVYLVLEVKNGDKWNRVYKSFNEYMNSQDDILQAKASQKFALMVYNENI